MSGEVNGVGTRRLSERGRQVSSLHRDWNCEGGCNPRNMPQSVVIKPTHIPSIKGRESSTMLVAPKVGWNQVEEWG